LKISEEHLAKRIGGFGSTGKWERERERERERDKERISFFKKRLFLLLKYCFVYDSAETNEKNIFFQLFFICLSVIFLCMLEKRVWRYLKIFINHFSFFWGKKRKNSVLIFIFQKEWEGTNLKKILKSIRTSNFLWKKGELFKKRIHWNYFEYCQHSNNLFFNIFSGLLELDWGLRRKKSWGYCWEDIDDDVFFHVSFFTLK
jgi:hypothetical protein